LRMSVSDVIELTRKFLKSEAGYDDVKFSSVEAIEPDAKWKVIARVEELPPNRKELIVDDKDGKIISYKQV
jgi:hypothetical protein